MELSELAAYAEEKFHISEQRNWRDYPGLSILADPDTGMWIAILMRQWDTDTGTELQRCDIKCGQQCLKEMSEPYLSQPFRMQNRKWVGVIFDDTTDPEVVFHLFDRAVYANEQRGYTITLDHSRIEPSASRLESEGSGGLRRRKASPSSTYRDSVKRGAGQQNTVRQTAAYHDTALPPAKAVPPAADPQIPDRIRKMQKLYEYRNNSFAQKCKNFYRQGKFMEDYEDNAPWSGEFRHYFPTYHDLNVRQLRGYFTWRTQARKGEFSPLASSLVYLYIYELLNGIGADGPEDSIKKLREFEIGFLDTGLGNPGMRRNLHRWMLGFSIVHNFPPEQARAYADPSVLERDTLLAILQNTEESSDEEIFSALCSFGAKKLEQSPVIKRDAQKGKYLFAAVWRSASRQILPNGRDLFSACFGERRSYPWHPLANAVYYERHQHADTDYVLGPNRIYHCRNGLWQEERYDKPHFDRKRFHALLRETDRLLRLYLKIGHYLKEDPNEAWTMPYIREALKAEERAKIDNARKAVTINLSDLEQIRQDSLVTRDSLLTEEELADGTEKAPHPEKATRLERSPQSEKETRLKEADETRETDTENCPIEALDPQHTGILRMLLEGASPETYIEAHHLMPSVVADTINEALFDEIGDNVLECDGNAITMIEDYREDLLELFGGK